MFEKAKEYVEKVKLSGYMHHRYEDEQNPISIFDAQPEYVEPWIRREVLSKRILLPYAEVLGPTRLRGMKNSVICFLVTYSRAAIAKGVDYELALCLSDFYINELERCKSEDEVAEVSAELLRHFYYLANENRPPRYSYHVSNAVVFIRQNLFNKLSVAAVAENEQLEKHYFSSLFKKETGSTPSAFILKEKLLRSRELLQDRGKSVTEIASSLCFSNPSHFCRAFREQYGMTPLRYREEYFAKF